MNTFTETERRHQTAEKLANLEAIDRRLEMIKRNGGKIPENFIKNAVESMNVTSHIEEYNVEDADIEFSEEEIASFENDGEAEFLEEMKKYL